MKARMARQSDAENILKLVKAAYRDSKYNGVGLDEKRGIEAIRYMIGMGFPPGLGSTAMFVVGDKSIDAALAAMCVPVYDCLNATLITDTFWYARKKNSRAGLAVLSAFHAWADTCAKPYVIRQGVTNFIADDPARAGRVLERKGLRRVGAIYEKECLA